MDWHTLFGRFIANFFGRRHFPCPVLRLDDETDAGSLEYLRLRSNQYAPKERRS